MPKPSSPDPDPAPNEPVSVAAYEPDADSGAAIEPMDGRSV
jgi:hypothetical protein